MIRYRAEHQRILDVAATTLELGLPRDHDVLSFLELPPNTFGVEDREDAHAQNEDDMQCQVNPFVHLSLAWQKEMRK